MTEPTNLTVGLLRKMRREFDDHDIGDVLVQFPPGLTPDAQGLDNFIGREFYTDRYVSREIGRVERNVFVPYEPLCTVLRDGVHLIRMTHEEWNRSIEAQVAQHGGS